MVGRCPKAASALALVAVSGCATVPEPKALSPLEREAAILEGRSLERSAPELDVRPAGGSYRLLHVTEEAVARLHPDTSVSILVLSGDVTLETARGRRLLAAGQSVVVPNGVPYELVTDQDQGSSVYLLFAPADPGFGVPPARVSLTNARTP